MNEVFVSTFDEYPPRSFAPSFHPANLMGEKLREIKARQKLQWAFPMLNTAPPAAAPK